MFTNIVGQARQRHEEEESDQADREELLNDLSQAEEVLSGEEGEIDEEERMQDYLLNQIDNPDLKWEFKDDERIKKILKLKGTKLTATVSYVRSQLRGLENKGLTSILVDNLANVLMRISGDPRTKELVKQDEQLRGALHRMLKSIDYIPAPLMLSMCIGNHVYNAFYTRWANTKVGPARAAIPANAP